METFELGTIAIPCIEAGLEINLSNALYQLSNIPCVAGHPFRSRIPPPQCS